MWHNLGHFILRYRIPLFIIVLALTGFMGYHASKTELSYEFARAIPTDNKKYIEYQEFRKKFGEDGNLLVIGIQTPDLFTEKNFNEYTSLLRQLKKVQYVEDIISVPSAVTLVKNPETEKL